MSVDYFCLFPVVDLLENKKTVVHFASPQHDAAATMLHSRDGAFVLLCSVPNIILSDGLKAPFWSHRIHFMEFQSS